MITKDGKDLPILEITPENYKVPAGEEGIYHVKMEVRLFDRSDGHRISHPFIQKFERIDFENGMMSMLRQQGYHMEILHNPQEWLKEHPQGEGRVKKDSGEAQKVKAEAEQAKAEAEKAKAELEAMKAKTEAEKKNSGSRQGKDKKEDDLS